MKAFMQGGIQQHHFGLPCLHTDTGMPTRGMVTDSQHILGEIGNLDKVQPPLPVVQPNAVGGKWVHLSKLRRKRSLMNRP